MKNASEWAKKFNDECKAYQKLPQLKDFKTVEEFDAALNHISFCNSQKFKIAWKESDFELSDGEINRDCCHQDFHDCELCEACRGNIVNFNESNTPESKEEYLMNRIDKLEAFIHEKFPEFNISDTD